MESFRANSDDSSVWELGLGLEQNLYATEAFATKSDECNVNSGKVN